MKQINPVWIKNPRLRKFALRFWPDTAASHYWEHPHHCDVKYDTYDPKDHPHEIIIWELDKSGQRRYGIRTTVWPFNGSIWAIDFKNEGDSQFVDRQKMKEIEEIKQWCLENCQGRWAWSREESVWMNEGGLWQHAKIFYLLLESEEDATYFRLCRDDGHSGIGRTVASYQVEIAASNDSLGWKQKEIEVFKRRK